MYILLNMNNLLTKYYHLQLLL